MSEERDVNPGCLSLAVVLGFGIAFGTLVGLVRRIADAQDRAHPAPTAEAGK